MAERQDINQPVGIYFDVPFEAYSRWKGANNTLLSILAEDTPAHLRYALDTGDGDETTDAQELGLCYHKLILEMDRFKGDVAIRPKEIKQRRGATWERFLKESGDKMIVKEANVERAIAMVQRMLAHPLGYRLFRDHEFEGVPVKGKNEVCLVWINEATGVRCKARLDRLTSLNGATVVVEAKTADQASRPKMERAVLDYCYHTQAAHGLDGLQTLMPSAAGPVMRRWVLAVCESRPPYEPAFYELEDGSLDAGNEDRLKWLAEWEKCERTGVWPGYGDGLGYVGLPAWKMKAFDARSA